MLNSATGFKIKSEPPGVGSFCFGITKLQNCEHSEKMSASSDWVMRTEQAYSAMCRVNGLQEIPTMTIKKNESSLYPTLHTVGLEP